MYESLAYVFEDCGLCVVGPLYVCEHLCLLQCVCLWVVCAHVSLHMDMKVHMWGWGSGWVSS